MRAVRAPLPVHRRRRRALRATAASAAAVALAAGCSSSEPERSAAVATAEAGVLPSAHVHAVAIDPGDGAVLLATHEGLIEVGADGELVPTGPVIDLMGFTVVGPDHYLASGHPGLRVDLPQPVGLIETTDGGSTWTPLSRQGESDFHALTASDTGILGFDGALRRSADGRTWEQLTIPAEPHTLSAAPDGTTVLATTTEGLLRSTDAGASWSPVAGAPLLQVVTWAGDGSTAVGIDPGGTLWTSGDAGSRWRERADVGAAPDAVAADADASRIVVVTEDGLLESTDGGTTITQRLEP